MKSTLNWSVTLALGITIIVTSVATAQTPPDVGKPQGNTLNFFSTDMFGGVLGHRQQGAFGNLTAANSRWIGIGRAPVPQRELYGMRIQDELFSALFSINDADPAQTARSAKDVEIQWGGPHENFPFLKFQYLLDSSTSREVMNLNGNGRLIVAPEETNVSNINFWVLGSANISGDLTLGGSLYQSSDRRLKENIKPLVSAEDKGGVANSDLFERLLKIEGVTYNLKSADVFTEEIGLIAQDVKKQFPELVVEDDKGMMAVNYTGLVPVLVEGMKEQQTKIESLNDRVERLETQLETLLENLP